MWRRFAMLLITVVLLAACSDGDTATTTSAAPPSTTVPATTTSAATTTVPPVTTTTLSPDTGLVWAQVPDDAAVFGAAGMSAVIAGGPGLVAAGVDMSGPDADAAVWVSPDGQTWERIPTDEAVFGGDGDQEITALAAGEAGLVAVGQESNEDTYEYRPAVWFSADGYEWARIRDEAIFGDGDWVTSVTAGGPGFVAGGWGGAAGSAMVWVSADGREWSRVEEVADFSGERDPIIWSLTAAGPGLVAVGFDSFMVSEMDVFIWVSEDGYSWTRIEDEALFNSPGDESAWSVAEGGPGVVAVGYSPGGPDVWVSEDGRDWTAVSLFTPGLGAEQNPMLQQVVAGGQGLMAIGDPNCCLGETQAVWLSADGYAWTRVDGPFEGGEVHGLAAGGPGMVAVGLEQGHAAVWVSPPPPDGQTTSTTVAAVGPEWSRVDDAAVFGGDGTQDVWAITPYGSGLAAVGSDTVVRSSNGVVQVAGGPSNGVVWLSADGRDWERIDEEAFQGADLRRVIAGGPGLVAAGSAPSGDSTVAAIWVSADGRTWERVADPDLDDSYGHIGSLAAGPSSLIATAAGRRVLVSPDGYDWTPLEDATFGGGTVNVVVAGGPGFVAAGYEYGHPSYDWEAAVWVSADGQSWVRVKDPDLGDGQIEAVVAGGPGFVAAGYTYGSDGSGDAVVWVSADGQAWDRIDDRMVFGGPGSQEIHALAAGPEGIVAADLGDNLWVSADGYAWPRADAAAAFGGGTIWSLGAWAGGLVAVGAVAAGNFESDAAIWLSPPPA